jgi:hypothetical protein
MRSLVGYTGFVGSNLASQARFDGLYNSSNISRAFGTKPDFLVYAGVRAEKYLANNDPAKDRALIDEAINNIQKIGPRTLVLISTIDVYENPVGVDEDTEIETQNLHPYGLNRYLLEKWVEEAMDSFLIVRLPGLYGKNIKKNFIFDMMNIIPSNLATAKFNELYQRNNSIAAYYSRQDNGFYRCKDLGEAEKLQARTYFENIGFSALNFTDSRAIFQFYSLAYLWGHVQIALAGGIRKLNIATEPVSAAELYQFMRGAPFTNELPRAVSHYDFRTKHSSLFNGAHGYIFDKTSVLRDVKRFFEGCPV